MTDTRSTKDFTEEKRSKTAAALADTVMLTANQAAEQLGIDRKAFDRLKKKYNLQPLEMRRSPTSEWLFAVYKLADIDRLRV